MIYDKYLESIRTSGFDVQSELSRAKRIFEKYYQPHIPPDKTSRILEIGCGFGKIIWAATQCGYTGVEGVDISDDQVAFAKKTLKLNVERCDAVEKLEKFHSELDVILVIDVLEHCAIEYAVELLQSARSALKAGGTLILQVPNGLSPLAPTFHGDFTHLRAYSAQGLAQLLRLAGFRKTSLRAMYPIIHGPLSAVRGAAWRLVLSPAICLYLLVATGESAGGIYTPNILAVAVNE